MTPSWPSFERLSGLECLVDVPWDELETCVAPRPGWRSGPPPLRQL